MDEKDTVFCTRCGAKMAPDAVYCPECGAQMAVIPQRTTEEYFDMHAPRKQSEMMKWVKILLFVYAGISILIGFMLAGLGGWSINVLEQTDPEYTKSLLESFGMTKSQYVDYCTTVGIISLVSGALALISGIMCVKRRYNKVAISICVVASLICFAQLFFTPSSSIASDVLSCAISAIIGCIVAYLIYKVKDEFDD